MQSDGQDGASLSATVRPSTAVCAVAGHQRDHSHCPSAVATRRRSSFAVCCAAIPRVLPGLSGLKAGSLGHAGKYSWVTS